MKQEQPPPGLLWDLWSELGEGLGLSLSEEGRCPEYQWAVNGKTKEEKEVQHRYKTYGFSLHLHLKLIGI